MRQPGVEPGSIAWKAIILTVGLLTLACVWMTYQLISPELATLLNKLFSDKITINV